MCVCAELWWEEGVGQIDVSFHYPHGFSDQKKEIQNIFEMPPSSVLVSDSDLIGRFLEDLISNFN